MRQTITTLSILAFTFSLLFPSITFSQSATYAWSTHQRTRSTEVTTDQQGNIYITGYYNGTVDFDPGPGVTTLTASAASDMFIQKLDPAKNLIWVRGIEGNVRTRDFTIDASGNVYVTGEFQGTADFDPSANVFNLSATQRDAFVLKLDVNGNFSWVNQLNGNASDFGNGIVCSATGVYVTGTFIGIVDFDPSAGTLLLGSSGTTINSFIQSFDFNGNLLWATVLDGNNAINANNIAIDVDDNLVITGYFRGTVDFNAGAGTFTMSSAPSTFGTNAFISKVRSSGAFMWALQFEGIASNTHAVTIDPDGYIYTLGYFGGTIDANTGPGIQNMTKVSASGNNDFIHKVDSLGKFQWAKQLGGSGGYINSVDLTSDAQGNVYNVGFYGTTIDFDPNSGVQNLTSVGTNDFFMQKLDKNGQYLWAHSIGNTYNTAPFAVTLDPANSIITVGDFFQTVDFDPGTNVRQHYASSTQSFIQKLGQCTGTMTASISETISSSWPYATSSLNSIVTNASGPVSYKWIRGGSVVSSTSQVISPCSGMTYELTVTDLTNGCTATTSYYFNNRNNARCQARPPRSFARTTSGLEKQQTADWALYPNPSKNKFSVTLDQEYTTAHVIITNITGQIVFKSTLTTTQQLSINLQQPAGIYLVQVEAGAQRKTFKLLIE